MRCNTSLNALVPHSQYLSSVPIEARFDPLQSQSHAIYPNLSCGQQTEQHCVVPPRPTSPIHNSPGQPQHGQGNKRTAPPSSPLLQPNTPQQGLIRSPRAGLNHAYIPPTTMTPPGDSAQHLQPPLHLEDGEHPPRLSPQMTPQRPSVSRMARPTASKAALQQQHPHDVAANRITKSDEHSSGAARHLGPPLSNRGNQAAQVRGRTTSTAGGPRTASAQQRAASRNPSMPKMARPSASRSVSNNLNDHQDIDELSHEPPTTAGEVYEYYQTLNPRWLHLVENYPDADMDGKWGQFGGDTKIARLAELVMSFQSVPATTMLDAAQDSEYKSCKADLERLFRDIQLDHGPSNMAPVTVPPSVGREVPMPSNPYELDHESFVLPSSVKAAERRLAMSESGSGSTTSSFPTRAHTQNSRPALRPRQSSFSWGSEATPTPGEDAPAFPSSMSTKGGDAAVRSGSGSGSGLPCEPYYVPTYLADDSDTENQTQIPKPQPLVNAAPNPFQTATMNASSERLHEDRTSESTNTKSSSRHVHVPTEDTGYPYVFESVHLPAIRKTETSLHHAPSTSSPASRRMLRTMNSVDIMNQSGPGQAYQYMSARDALRNQHENWNGNGRRKLEPVRGQHGEVARYYGDYMKVGDHFVPYSSGDEVV